jgi:hypothetical protein
MHKSILIILALLSFSQVSSQTKITTENFTKINISGNANIRLAQDSSCALVYSGNNSLNLIDHSVKNGTLTINGFSGDNLLIKLPFLESVTISGIGKVTGESTFEVNELNLDVSGDGKMELDINAKKVNAEVSGLGKITLSGTAQDANFLIPGSGKIDAINLKTIRCNANISGMGKCEVDVIDEMNTNISGAGSIIYKNRPKIVNENISGVGSVKKAKDEGTSVESGADTTRLTFGDDQVWIIGKKDSYFEKRQNIKPIWQGFEMGINTYMDDGGTFTLDPDKKNFELREEKSVSVGLNLLQTQFELGNSNTWFFTGLGVTWNNYRFDSDVYLENGPYTNALVDTTSNMGHIKSKLVAVYLTAPVMFEVFTSRVKKRTFHIGVGGMLGYKIGSHTKRKVEIDGDISKQKEFDDFNLNNFRYGFRAAIGFGSFNVYADYYPSALFEKNKGPELYPVNFGITLLGF